MKANDVEIIKFHDDLTFGKMEEYLNEKSGKTYIVFSSFMKKAVAVKMRKRVEKPENFVRDSLRFEFQVDIESFLPKINHNIYKGGRNNALKKIKAVQNMTEDEYLQNRENLSGITTGLSPYLKFGCISIIEAYKAFKKN